MAEIKPMNPMNAMNTTNTESNTKSAPSLASVNKPQTSSPSTNWSKPATAAKAKSSAKPAAKKSAKPMKSSAKKSFAKKAAPKSSSSSATKSATSSAAGKTSATTNYKGAGFARSTGKQAMEMGADKMKRAFSDGARESQKLQDQFLQMTRESADEFAKISDASTRSLNDFMEQSRGSFEACIESGNITADMTRAFTNELFRVANETFSDNMEVSKEIFSCKTANDLYEMQNKAARNNLNHFFNQSSRFSDMFFQYMTDASEPFNQRTATSSKKYKY